MTSPDSDNAPKPWIDNTFRRIMIGFSFQDPEQIERTTPLSDQ